MSKNKKISPQDLEQIQKRQSLLNNKQYELKIHENELKLFINRVLLELGLEAGGQYNINFVTGEVHEEDKTDVSQK